MLTKRVSPLRRVSAMAVLFGGSIAVDVFTGLSALLIAGALVDARPLVFVFWLVSCVGLGAAVCGFADSIRDSAWRPFRTGLGVTLMVSRVASVFVFHEVFALDASPSPHEVFLSTVAPSLAVFVAHWVDEARRARSDYWRTLAGP